MNTENEMNEEVRQLLDSLEEHGKNDRRQQDLSDLIDRLANNESGTVPSLRGTKQSRKQVDSLDCFVVPPRNDAKRRKLIPLWWAMGAAAALLLLWLLVKQDAKQNPDRNEEIFVEETGTVDTVIIKVNEEVHEEPVVEETLLAEETNQPGLPPVPSVYPSGLLRSARNDETERLHEGILQEQLIAEASKTKPLEPQEPTDTTNIESNNKPDTNKTPSAVQSHKRRVIRSLNLVCYECQKEPEFFTKPVLEDRTLFGQPQDPNMKNGALAFEIKLN
ncbi:MAG: hypothetical protein J6P83_04565 [Bacteroidales bacterium]|nr:hypothetical protein [Bacteroidales bacterium]